VVERLVGLHAQVPRDAYVALWSRIEGFRPERLSAAIEDRRAVRMTLHRGTLHLVTADDALALRPLAQPAIERTVLGSSPLRTVKDRVDMDEVLAFVRGRLEECPSSRIELVAAIRERWPDRDADPLGFAIYLLDSCQVTPRGLWGRSGRAAFTTLERWLGRSPAASGDASVLAIRYLEAFGPASAADAQTWSGLGGMRELLDRLRPRLRTFRGEDGRELFDVPRAPLPDPDTPAPVRYLPEYDNASIGFKDRSRILPNDLRPWTDPGWGRSSSTARSRRDGDCGTRTGDRSPGRAFRRLSRSERDEAAQEGARLASFLTSDTQVPVRLTEGPAG
jgi:hypothetical protein